MEQIVDLIVNNGVAVGCIIYFMWTQNNTMNKLNETMSKLCDTVTELHAMVKTLHGKE